MTLTPKIQFTQYSGTVYCTCGEQVYFDGEWTGTAKTVCKKCGRTWILTTSLVEVKGVKHGDS